MNFDKFLEGFNIVKTSHRINNEQFKDELFQKFKDIISDDDWITICRTLAWKERRPKLADFMLEARDYFPKREGSYYIDDSRETPREFFDRCCNEDKVYLQKTVSFLKRVFDIDVPFDKESIWSFIVQLSKGKRKDIIIQKIFNDVL